MGSNPGEGIKKSSFFCGVEDQMEGSNGRIECDLRSSRNKRSFESTFFEELPSTKYLQYINVR